MKGIVLPVVLIIVSSLSVIIIATSIIANYFLTDVITYAEHEQIRYLAQSALNLGVREITAGRNLDGSDENNYYSGIGAIDPFQVTVILNGNEVEVTLSCTVDDLIDENYQLTGTAETDFITENVNILVRVQ